MLRLMPESGDAGGEAWQRQRHEKSFFQGNSSLIEVNRAEEWDFYMS